MAQSPENHDTSNFSPMYLYQQIASSEGFESSSADRRRQMEELRSTAATLDKQAFELKQMALKVTQHLDKMSRENTHFVTQNKQLRTELLATLGTPPGAAMAVSAEGLPAGLELDARLRSLVQAARTSLAMAGLGAAAWADGSAVEEPQAEQEEEEEEVEPEKPWPVSTHVAQVPCHSMLPAARRAPQAAEEADMKHGALGGQPWQQEVGGSQGLQTDLTHSMLAVLEKAACRQSQEAARMQEAWAAHAQLKQEGDGGYGAIAGAGMSHPHSPRPGAAVQGPPPPLLAVGGSSLQGHAQGLLQATAAVVAARQRRKLLEGRLLQAAANAEPAAGQRAPQAHPFRDEAPAAAQQDMPFQPVPQKRALFPLGPMVSGQAQMAHTTVPPAAKSLKEPAPPLGAAAGSLPANPAQALLQAMAVANAVQQPRELLEGSLSRAAANVEPAAAQGTPPARTARDTGPAAAQQDAPPQPAPARFAPLPPGPVVVPGQTRTARPAVAPAAAPLEGCAGGAQRRLHGRSLGAGATTLTVRNVPGRYTQERLIEEWGPEEHSYDFLFLPFSLKDQRSKGYAFVNFTTHEAALAFQRRWHRQHLALCSRTRALDIVMAPVQGYWANLQCLRGNLSDEHLPATFSGSSRLDTRSELQRLPPP